MDVRALSSVTDFFVLCTAGSARQLAAVKECVEEQLDRAGCPLWHAEGVAASTRLPAGASSAPQWILMDFGDVIVHLFDQPTRAFYRLEDLWADAPRLPMD
jgi:ribosome-associated protein